MGSNDNRKLFELIDPVKSWVPRQPEPAKMSRDFWMPDSSCRVCYECDSQFTIFNRRHHCRLCGRVFCAKCTTNCVLTPSDDHTCGLGDHDRIRVCKFCLHQRKQHSATDNNMMVESSPGFSLSPSSSSSVSTQSSCCTCNSGSTDSTGYSTEAFHQVSCAYGQGLCQSIGSVQMDSSLVNKDQTRGPWKPNYLVAIDTSSEPYGSCSRSDEENDDYLISKSHSEVDSVSSFNMGYSILNHCKEDHNYEPCEVHTMEETTHSTCDSIVFSENCEKQGLEMAGVHGKEADPQISQVQSEQSSLNDSNIVGDEVVEYENNGLIWNPSEPKDVEDEREGLESEDDGDGGETATGEWGYLRSSSFLDGESRSRDRSNEEHRRAMKRVVDAHFRSLITQLLQAEKLPDTEHQSWLDIISTLSWEAATLIKPDTSRGGGMDPGGYVKVKCVACGLRNESTVIKGVACKKNVAHRRMTSKIDKARLLLVGGALEYQRVANHLSSFDTLLQQEMDHLKMAVAKIDAHHPNVLLVEKSVSRYAQDYLLAKNISLVLNIKRPLLERIARCTGAQIVPSIDNLSAPPKLGYCESFHVERFLENLGTVGQGGKKLTKALMFFEGCPRPLGCTILLKGANGDELKKVKHVVHYGVFAAYHLAMETSFLADEGASLPELPLKSPLKVAMPNNLSSCNSSISKIPGPQEQQQSRNACEDKNNLYCGVMESSRIPPVAEAESFRTEDYFGQTPNAKSATKVDVSNSGSGFSCTTMEQLSAVHYPKENGGLGLNGHRIHEVRGDDDFHSSTSSKARAFGPGFTISHGDGNNLPVKLDNSKLVRSGLHNIDCLGELGTPKEEFTPSASDHQSILVSLSTRCVWKGSVCERAHIFRIKYYGNFDKPLGRFLRDNLFDQDYRCHSCEMPSEAHVHCYTHRQGSLTISLRRLKEFILPGEREGKIWMWHRCLRCPRINGLPPATKRIVMSNAAWGLSFGKFLELSFSNHAAASRVASCGHSLHRDCLRFYGFGRMVACFHYAPINVHSVYLPPPKIEFNYTNQEWIQKDFDTLRNWADFLFTEVLKVLHQISERTQNDAGMKEKLILELELMIQIEKKEFEEAMRCIPKKALKSGHLEIDILEVNKLKRQLIFHAYVWDQRLVHLSRGNARSLSSPMTKDKLSNSREQQNELDSASRSGRGFSSWDSSVVNMRPDMVLTDVEFCPVNSPIGVRKAAGSENILISGQDTLTCHSLSINSSSSQPETPQCGHHVRRARSEGQFPVMDKVSHNLGDGWTCHEDKVVSHNTVPTESSSGLALAAVEPVSKSTNNRLVAEQASPSRSALPAMRPTNVEDPSTWVRTPFSVIYRSVNKNSTTCAQKLGKISEYNPVYISSLKELINQGGARLLLPMASSDVIVPIYDDEPTSMISYALVSPDYKNIISKDPEKHKHSFEFSTSFSLLDSINFFSLHSFDDSQSESVRSLTSVDESILSSGAGLDQLQFPDTLHNRLTFSDDGPSGKVNYSVTCYFSRQFETLRKTCITSELDFIRSLSRCKKWGAQGGKSNVFFAKTLDDRFIIKQVTKTELESFIKFAPSYFKYLSESINSGCPTCLAKILGIYQVTSKHLKGGKETRIDVLVMENLLFRRNITRLYDLKGSSRSRYNPDSSGSNKVLLDQNLIEAMPTSPIFLGTKAKRLLERAIWNDTSFLASINVMDYSLLVGLDEEKHELVVGIIDFMRQYTWDKHLESWVKASGILGGPKNVAPTVISPEQYKKRFRKAMSAYFLMVPDEWPCSMTTHPSCSLSNLSEGNLRDKVSTHS